ncbi:predicted protein [Botrytis cinerea T4]|uniref:Uncharacterized protein n=1 Tax=Botryotinia fuckeliana (strain T4) TaxID=999810 RepID=G2Y0W4_BOTF4|nr:predicted protein [Botrytis cinerea T4]
MSKCLARPAINHSNQLKHSSSPSQLLALLMGRRQPTWYLAFDGDP